MVGAVDVKMQYRWRSVRVVMRADIQNGQIEKFSFLELATTLASAFALFKATHACMHARMRTHERRWVLTRLPRQIATLTVSFCAQHIFKIRIMYRGCSHRPQPLVPWG